MVKKLILTGIIAAQLCTNYVIARENQLVMKDDLQSQLLESTEHSTVGKSAESDTHDTTVVPYSASMPETSGWLPTTSESTGQVLREMLLIVLVEMLFRYNCLNP